MKTVYFIPLLLLLTGCTFTGHTHIAWLDPAYAPASGDSLFALRNQEPKSNVTVYRNGALPDRPYHEILMLAVEGNGNQGPDAVEAFLDLSRRAGANAVLIERPSSGLSVHEKNEAQIESAANNGSERAIKQTQNSTISADDLAPNRRYLFQATAVVWDSKPLNSGGSTARNSSALPMENTATNIVRSPRQK